MLYHHRLWGLRHVNCQAYKSELTEFIELVQAGRDSELHRLEQKAMLRHPNVVRTTIAAEMSWKQGNTMEIAKDWVWVPWVTDVVRVGPGENQSGTLGKQDLNSMQLQKILVSVLIRNYPVVFSCFFPMIFMYFPLSKCAFRSLLSTLPFVSCWRRSIPCWPGRRMARWPPKWMTCSAPRSSGALTSLRRWDQHPATILAKKRQKKRHTMST